MGQKTNATVFRIGTENQEWQSKYIEIVKEESFLYAFQTLSLRTYLKRLLKTNGLLLHTCKICHSKNSLHVFISYYTTTKSVFITNETNIQQKIIRIKKRQPNKFSQNSINFQKDSNRLKFIKYYKRILLTNKSKNIQTVEANRFITRLTESVLKVTKQNTSFFLTLQNLNKGLSLNLTKNQAKSIKKILIKFRRTLNNTFFKEMLNVVIISVLKKNSAEFLSDFIANNLNKVSKSKKQRFFLVILKQLLVALSKTELYKINGIKIVVKGRLNGVPRTKKQEITIGRTPLQSFKAKITYHQSVSYSMNGTLGVKVWIAEKNYLCSCNQKNQSIVR